PVKVSTTRPWLSSTSRQPAFEVAGSPPVVGRLPTTTQPPSSIDSAVVRPIPPGQARAGPDAVIRANNRTAPRGETDTIVVPVPCWLAELLKLLTSTFPWTSLPWLCRTTATP